ncbi:MAG: ribosomal protection-like ABC-F family protein [Anaerolineae bacterium]
MLHVSNLSKSYNAEPVLNGVSFVVNDGERVGLVGPNGCGKTTLLRLVMGLEQPDGGKVRLNPPGLSVGYLAQALIFAEGETVRQTLAGAAAEQAKAQAEMEHLTQAMAEIDHAARLAELTAAYADAEARFQATGGYELEVRQEELLAGLGLADVPRDLPVALLSGGQKTRLGLARLLLQRPRLLLLDEPTNHLDIDALAWLEGWLCAYDGAAVIVSHDRTFLDATTTRTLVIDPKKHTLSDYPGNYSAYAQARARQIEQQWQAYKDQQEYIAQVEEKIRHLSDYAKAIEQGTINFATRKIALGIARQATMRKKRLERELERNQIEKPSQQWRLKLAFSADDRGARQVLRLENLSMAFPSRTLFEDVSLTLRHGERAALIGPNGAGKTTLLRIIIGELSPTGGQARLGPGVKVGYLAQGQETLDASSTPYEAIRAVAAMDETGARTFLHQFLFSGDDVFIKVGSLSLGERARLMLALLVAQGCNLLLLDEPINHLDIESRERFEEALLQFPGTILAVVHDRTFIHRVATSVWELREGRVRVI